MNLHICRWWCCPVGEKTRVYCHPIWTGLYHEYIVPWDQNQPHSKNIMVQCPFIFPKPLTNSYITWFPCNVVEKRFLKGKKTLRQKEIISIFICVHTKCVINLCSTSFFLFFRIHYIISIVRKLFLLTANAFPWKCGQMFVLTIEEKKELISM